MNKSAVFIAFTVFTLALPDAAAFAQAVPTPAPPVSLKSLPRFRGFNLLEKFTVDSNRPYREEDFRLIAELEFNFVRLPLDYRCFVGGDDTRALDEKTMGEIDEAVRFGLKYNVHVCLNFHRAPGYCVNPPQEKTSLWTDAAAQGRFAGLWGSFAARYSGVSSRALSFNLVNEPGELDAAVYASVMAKAVRAIRAVDPHRLIVIDGLHWGQLPAPGINGEWIIQSGRGYSPMEITHFKASWVNGADRWPAPVWPMYKKIPAFLYGPEKSEWRSPLVLQFSAERATVLTVTLHQVSRLSRLVVKTDGRAVFDKIFKPGPGQGEWTKVVFEKQWNIYQNIYDKAYAVVVPAGTKSIEIENTEGDWLTFSALRLEPYAALVKEPVVLFTSDSSWGARQGTLRLSPTGAVLRGRDEVLYDGRWLRDVHYAPWIEFEKKGGAVMLGECGVFNRTPHAVALAFLEDLLKTVKGQGWGWALWNFRGGFGVLDSERTDVNYEDWRGHKLDRKMLEMLKKY